MKINLGAKVNTENNKSIGEIEQIVVDPADEEITHVVIKKGAFFTQDKLVPIGMVGMVNEGEIHLRASEEEIEQLPDFETKFYVNYDDLKKIDNQEVGYAARLIMYPPAGVMGMPAGPRFFPPVVTRTEKNIAPHAVAIKEGADVIGLEGNKAGDVEEIIMDPRLDRVTYFVISKGMLFKERKLLPTTWVRNLKDGKIKLTVNEKIIQQLPDYT